MVPIHQIMLHIRCLDACKADTESKFLSPQLKGYHKTLIGLFKPWLEVWINPGDCSRYERIVDKPLDKIMEMHLPNLQYVLGHTDIRKYIDSYFMDCKNEIESQKNINKNDKRKTLIMDRFYILPYLCISEENSDMLVECFISSFKCEFIQRVCMESHRVISSKLKEEKLEKVLTFLLHGLTTHDDRVYVKSLGEIASNLSERQLKGVFDFFMEEISKNKRSIELCAKSLAIIAVQLGKKYLKEAHEKLLELSNTRNENVQLTNSYEVILKHLKEDSFQELKNGLNHKDQTIRQTFARVLGTTHIRFEGKVLDGVLRNLMNRINDMNCVKALESISKNLNKEQLDYFLQCLKDGLKHNDENTRYHCAKWENKYIHQLCAKSLNAILMRLDQGQLPNALEKVKDALSDQSKYIRKVGADLLIAMIKRLCKTQLKDLFSYLIGKTFEEKNKCVQKEQVSIAFKYIQKKFNGKCKKVQYSCAESIRDLARHLNQKQLNIAFKLLLNKFKNKDEDKLVRMSCAESLGQMAMKVSKKKLRTALNALMDALNDEMSGIFVRKYCTYALKTILTELEKNENFRDFVQSRQLMIPKFKEERFKNTITQLLNGLNDKDESTFFRDAFECLINRFNDENGEIGYLCETTLRTILSKLKEKQLNTIFKNLVIDLMTKIPKFILSVQKHLKHLQVN
ncbi:hypothetical protein RFI_06166 [Reticulomyxa filosa]|uniref:Uncharacterized protein n=1 Tax=Reticulomyxa filosa TaxID=46433 RepID=X6NXC6_RETFI|nr:hypothetical protein RFI_06166 [Reticulomyxa filosa]|eukprot:ETO30955.1 hypothetical protein RFI_06166 [Reticulomyxa filosa]